MADLVEEVKGVGHGETLRLASIFIVKLKQGSFFVTLISV